MWSPIFLWNKYFRGPNLSVSLLNICQSIYVPTPHLLGIFHPSVLSLWGLKLSKRKWTIWDGQILLKTGIQCSKRLLGCGTLWRVKKYLLGRRWDYLSLRSFPKRQSKEPGVRNTVQKTMYVVLRAQVEFMKWFVHLIITILEHRNCINLCGNSIWSRWEILLNS